MLVVELECLDEALLPSCTSVVLPIYDTTTTTTTKVHTGNCKTASKACSFICCQRPGAAASTATVVTVQSATLEHTCTLKERGS